MKNLMKDDFFISYFHVQSYFIFCKLYRNCVGILED